MNRSRRGEGLFSKSEIGNRKSEIAFTLIELLVVISILGILAGLTVPALKNLGKSNVHASASRQLLDDVGRARQLAMSHRTTVYMVFVPESFWNSPTMPSGTFNSAWWNNLTAAQKAVATNLLDKQFTGYTFVSLRSVGDQPGQGVPRYLAEWKSLPDGAFIATNKFYLNSVINDYSIGATYPIYQFYYSGIFPFPVETNFVGVPSLPYIAFNYLGQLTVLTSTGEVPAQQDEYIPLAQGNVGYALDANKALILAPPDATENPPGNSTNSMFTIVHIDRLTGRAVLLHQKMP